MSDANTTPVPASENKPQEHISEWERRRYVPKAGEPALPPQLAEYSNKTTDEVIEELNRLPFFMTKLDESDGEGGENINLEALKSLAYEGDPDEIATNFKNQGNNCYKFKKYKDAIIFYTKGLEVDCRVPAIDSALYLNRAACNLELKNYRRCIEDCKKVLMIDEKNIKACFRSGRAFFAIEKFDEAIKILEYGLSVDPENKDLQKLLKTIKDKQQSLAEIEAKKMKEEEQLRLENIVLENSIKLRHIEIIKSSNPPDSLKEAKIRLEDPKDYQSQLIFPAMILYPTTDEFDFIGEISELSTPLELLEIVLDRPREWFDDAKHKDFHVKKLECFMETGSGGLVKVGKKLEVNNALMSDKPKAPLFDNALRLYVVPKTDVAKWTSEWNKETALAARK